MAHTLTSLRDFRPLDRIGVLGASWLRLREKQSSQCSGRHTYLPTAITGNDEIIASFENSPVESFEDAVLALA